MSNRETVSPVHHLLLGTQLTRTTKFFMLMATGSTSPDHSNKGRDMATKEFDAHKWEKKPTTVTFRTKDGDRVRFTAEKERKVPVHVKFKTRGR
jgi:hypothetical protein